MSAPVIIFDPPPPWMRRRPATGALLEAGDVSPPASSPAQSAPSGGWGDMLIGAILGGLAVEMLMGRKPAR